MADVHRSQVDDSGTDTTTTIVGTAGTPLGRWGHLLLVKKIGEGAYGEVFEAIDTWLDHRRALKLLKPHIAGEMSAHQILHEARKLVRVRHPNVVMVHGADKHDGRLGFWMDLIEGHTLEERLRSGRFSPGEATYVGREVCSALAAVHQADLVHRDVKAQNVMRASDGGRIILMDFGAGEFRGAPSDGRAQGTPLYLAPEMFIGMPASVQTDIYALGTLLFYLVTGRFPVEGRSFPDIAVAHDRNRRRYLRDVRPDLPDSFVRVVERAIDPEPRHRFQTAGDFHEALRADAIPVVEPPRPQPTPPVPAIDPMQALGYAVVAAVTIFAIIEVLGFIAARAFEVAFHVDSEFTAGPAEYFRIGREALLPFVIYWVVGAAVVAIYTVVRQFSAARFGRLLGPLARRFDEATPVTLARSIAVAGAASAAVVIWAHSSLFSAMFAVHNATPVNLPDVSVIGQGFRSAFFGFSQYSAFLSFLLILAVFRWFPALERRASHDTARIGRIKWIAAAIAAIVVALAVAPRRIAIERFEVVEFTNGPSFVIGMRGDELLLYPADRVAAAGQRIHRGDPGLKRTNVTRAVADR